MQMGSKNIKQPSGISCPFCGASLETPLRNPSHIRPASRKGKRLNKRAYSMDAEELQEMLEEFSLKQIAGWYGSSQKGVEKWCRALGIAGPSRDAFIQAETESILPEEQE